MTLPNDDEPVLTGLDEAVDDILPLGEDVPETEEEPVEDGAETVGGEPQEEDAPPAGYAALVEEFGEEEANRFYAAKLGVKDEPEEEAQDDTSADDEWAMAQMAETVEEEAEQAADEATALKGTLDRDWDTYEANRNKIAEMRGERDAILERIDKGESEDNGKDSRAVERLTDQMAKLRSTNEAIEGRYEPNRERYIKAAQVKAQAESKLKAIKSVERAASNPSFPALKANKALFAKLAVEGRIPKGASYSQIVALISEERVKAGKKPVTTTQAANKQSATKPAAKGQDKARMSWKELTKKLGAPRLGGQRTTPAASRPAAKAKAAAGDPISQEINRFVAEVAAKKKGATK